MVPLDAGLVLTARRGCAEQGYIYRLKVRVVLIYSVKQFVESELDLLTYM